MAEDRRILSGGLASGQDVGESPPGYTHAPYTELSTAPAHGVFFATAAARGVPWSALERASGRGRRAGRRSRDAAHELELSMRGASRVVARVRLRVRLRLRVRASTAEIARAARHQVEAAGGLERGLYAARGALQIELALDRFH